MASHREKGACGSVLRADRSQLSAVAFGSQCQEQAEDTWSAGAATRSPGRGVDEGGTECGAGTGIVATVSVGSSGATTDGAENVAPTAGESEANPPVQPNSNAPAASPAGGTTTAAGAADTAPKTDATPTAPGQAADAPNADGSTTQDGTQNALNGDSKKESTSKKKKGLRKVLPW